MLRLSRRARALPTAPAALVSLLAALLVLPSTADAHTRLVRSDPAHRAALTALPRAIRLWFSEAPQLPFTHVHLVAADGKEVTLGAPEAIPRHGVSLAVMGPLPTGAYTIRWQTGGADGHPTRGEIAFTVAVPADDSAAARTTAAPSRTMPARPAEAQAVVPAPSSPNEMAGGPSITEPVPAKKWIATRWVELVAMVLVLGAIGFRLAVLPRWRGNGIDEVSDAARRYAQPALVLLVVAALARLAAESVAMHGARAYEAETLAATLLGTTWGRGWLTGVGGALLAGLGFVLAGRRMPGAWAIAALGAVLLACGASLTGHAMGSDVWWAAAPVDAIHVLAAGTWVGGVLMLALVGVPGARREPNGAESVRRLVHAFNPLAIAMVALVTLSGLVSAWMRLGALAAIWGSDYGRILLVKLGVVAVVAALGFYNWRRITPTLGDDAGATRLRRSASFEALCGVIVLAITAILIVTPLPEPSAPAAGAATTAIP